MKNFFRILALMFISVSTLSLSVYHYASKNTITISSLGREVFGASSFCITEPLGKEYFIIPAHCIDAPSLIDRSHNVYTPLLTYIPLDIALLLGPSHNLRSLTTHIPIAHYGSPLPSGRGLEYNSALFALVLGHENEKSILFFLSDLVDILSSSPPLEAYHIQSLRTLF